MGFPKKDNKYRLELHWKKVVYNESSKIRLVGAYFCGPVLKIASQINCNDNIVLDTTHQHSIFIPSFYLSRFSWKSVNYTKDKVFLKDAYLELANLNSIPKINNKDFFIINCEKHEEETHANYLTYESYLVDENEEVYNF